MTFSLNIRPSLPQESEIIYSLHKEAFDPSEAEVVAQLACKLLTDPSAEPLLSLVAEQEETIIGHVIFSSATIQGEESLSAFILSPLAVSKSLQKQGVGTQLVRQGLTELRNRGADIVFVYGDPNYYGRCEFKVGHEVAAPYDLSHPSGWMALELKPGIFSTAQGTLKCADAFNTFGF